MDIFYISQAIRDYSLTRILKFSVKGGKDEKEEDYENTPLQLDHGYKNIFHLTEGERKKACTQI